MSGVVVVSGALRESCPMYRNMHGRRVAVLAPLPLDEAETR